MATKGLLLILSLGSMLLLGLALGLSARVVTATATATAAHIFDVIMSSNNDSPLRLPLSCRDQVLSGSKSGTYSKAIVASYAGNKEAGNKEAVFR